MQDRVVFIDAGHGEAIGPGKRREAGLRFAEGALPQMRVWLKLPWLATLSTNCKRWPPAAVRYGVQLPAAAQARAYQA